MKCTNAQLGAALGLSHSTVSRMRSGTRIGSVRTLIRLAEVSGVTLDDVAWTAVHVSEGDDEALEKWHGILDKACGIGGDDESGDIDA